MRTETYIAGLMVFIIGCGTASSSKPNTNGDATGADASEPLSDSDDSGTDTAPNSPDLNTGTDSETNSQCEPFFAWNGTSCAAICGDNEQVGDEVCDDGNTNNGDGCRSDCLGLEECGDGHLDMAADENCDDGNLKNGDGCDDRCEIEAIEGPCGDGVVNIGEECDDANNTAGDGCENCAFAINSNWSCDPSLFSDGNGCECGCGQLDPDCKDALEASCDFCGGIGSCNPDDLTCQNIDPTNNALCK